MMREPAQASSGVTYEKNAIFQWLAVHRVDPVTQVDRRVCVCVFMPICVCVCGCV